MRMLSGVRGKSRGAVGQLARSLAPAWWSSRLRRLLDKIFLDRTKLMVTKLTFFFQTDFVYIVFCQENRNFCK